MKNNIMEKIKEIFIFFFKNHLYVMPILFIIDMVSKFSIEALLLTKPGWRIEIIPNFFSLQLLYNTGSFSGFLGSSKVGTTILMFLSLIGGTFGVYFLAKKFFKLHPFVKAALYLLIPGAYGNMIDRFLCVIGVKKGVIDFLSFRFFNKWDFNIFNFADICLTIAMFMILFYFIFEKQFNKNRVKESEENHE